MKLYFYSDRHWNCFCCKKKKYDGATAKYIHKGKKMLNNDFNLKHIIKKIKYLLFTVKGIC